MPAKQAGLLIFSGSAWWLMKLIFHPEFDFGRLQETDGQGTQSLEKKLLHCGHERNILDPGVFLAALLLHKIMREYQDGGRCETRGQAIHLPNHSGFEFYSDPEILRIADKVW